MAAWTWSDQFDLRKEIEELGERLADKGFDDLGESQVMRSLAAIVLNDIETDALVDVRPGDLIAGMSKLKQAMHATIDFLDSEFRIRNSVFIPFPIMVVPLVRFFAETLRPSASQRSQLRRWFWHCALTQRYMAGTNTAVREDLRLMLELAGGKEVFNNLQATISPNLFTKTWRINSTAAKATICLLAQLIPRSFPSDTPIDLGTTLAAYNARQFHHIYPKSFLAKQGIQFHQSNVIANICMLTASDNNEIGDDDPKDYFPKIQAAVRDKSFRRALIPPAFWDGSKPYADFMSERAKLLSMIAEELIATGVATVP